MCKEAAAAIFALAAVGFCALMMSLHGAAAADSFSDICSIDESQIQAGKTLQVRAAVIPAAGWYVSGLVGRNCTDKIRFTIDGQEPPALVDEINRVINQGKGLSVEADMTLFVGGFRPGPANSKIDSSWSVLVKDAKNFRRVPISFNEANR